MRYGIAALMAVLVIFAGACLAGAGHGWGSGAAGSLALAPVVFYGWVNALGREPSFRGAITVVVLGLAILVAVAFATIFEGLEYFSEFFDVNGIAGVSIACFAYFNPALASMVAISRRP